MLLLGREESEHKISEVKMKNPSSFFILLNISNGVHKLVRSFKTFSQLFGKQKLSISLVIIYLLEFHLPFVIFQKMIGSILKSY